jgi:hypothetical protein
MIREEGLIRIAKRNASKWQFWVRVLLLPVVWSLALIAEVGDRCNSILNWLNRNLPLIPR